MASGAEGRRHPALALLACAVLASAALLLALGSRLTFFLDDWTFLLYRNGSFADSFLRPHGENVVVGLSLAYRGLAEAFGIDSALPFRAVATALFAACSVLLFVLLRERVGSWLALLGASLTLFLGAAWEDLLFPIQIGYFGALACGLGALVALERRTPRLDLLACALLTTGVATFSVAIPFVAGAAVAIARGRDRARRGGAAGRVAGDGGDAQLLAHDCAPLLVGRWLANVIGMPSLRSHQCL